jgi:hypothetical protein
MRLGAPQAVNNLRRLAAHRGELGPERLTGLLSQATGDTELTETITSLLDQLDGAETGMIETLALRAQSILTSSPGISRMPLEPASPETAGQRLSHGPGESPRI